MTKRKLAFVLLGIFAVAASVLAVFGLSGERTVRIDEPTLQRAVNAQLPKSYKGMTIEKATILLRERDALISTTITGTTLGQSFSLEASGVGTPEYRKEAGAFYVRPSELAVTQLELTGKSATDRLQGFTEKYVTDPKLKERIEATLPGVKLWIADNVIPRALEHLGSMPLYTPKNDMKGVIIKASLSKMAVENGAVVLTFSLLQLSISAAIALLALLASIGLVIALVRNPGWGMAVVALSSWA